ncbi:MAG: acyl-CoA dehydrogenase family protein [Acidimicrobiia bacterium]
MEPVDELSAFLPGALDRLHAEVGQDRSFAASLAWQRILSEGNWVAPSWPVEFGGRSLSPTERIPIDEALAASGAPQIAGTLGVKNVGPTLLVYGTTEQKQHLARILSTEELWCQGFSEPDAGSDLASMKTRAERDGEEFVINGEKVWTTNGLRATHCELLVRTDPSAPKHKGISALLVPLDLPGIERRPIHQLTGGTDFAAMSFTDVRVPVSALLGPLNEGWKVTTTTLAHERSGIAMFAVRSEHEIVEYVLRQAGAALAPSLRHELVDRYMEARINGWMGRNILATLLAGGEPTPEQSVIKLAWSTTGQRFGQTRLNVAGLDAIAGLAPDDTFAFLQSRSSTIAAGTTEVMKNILAERVLGLPREP